MIRSLAISAALMPGTALAGDGFYAGVGVGQAMADGIAKSDPSSFSAGMPPESMSVDGFLFDSNETAWNALLGWNVASWISLEVGYRDFGSFDSSVDFLSVCGPGRPPTLDVEEWSLGARFRHSLSSRFTASWFVGLSRAEFEAQGSFPVGGIPFPGPGPGLCEEIPFSSPDNEIGSLWGLGFEYTLNERVGLELGYRRHDTRVLEIDTLALGLLYAF